jgi:hypothetical protein
LVSLGLFLCASGGDLARGCKGGAIAAMSLG